MSVEVPVISHPTPGFVTPAPRSAAGKSPAPTATGVPARRPVSFAASFVTNPSSSEAAPSDGNLSGSKSNRRRIFLLQTRLSDIKHVAAGGFAEVDLAFTGKLEVDIILRCQKRPGCLVRLGWVLLDPSQLKCRPCDCGRVRGDGKQRVRVMFLKKSNRPDRGFVYRSTRALPPARVRRRRRSRLSACICPQAAIPAIRSAASGTSSMTRRIPKDDSFPPDSRTLLGPAKTRNDLVILFRGESDYLSGLADECGSGASGSDVDRKQEILCHEQQRGESKRNSGDWPTQYDRFTAAGAETGSRPKGAEESSAHI